MLNLIGIGERAGSRVPDIYSVWEQQGWTEPEFEEQYAPDRTILKLSFLEKVTIKNGDNDKSGDKKIGVKTKQQLARILSFMEIGKSYKTSDIADAKIEKAQEQVSKTKQQYDAAVAVLSDLLDKREALYSLRSQR